MIPGFYPWDLGKKPYFVNEEGFEWYVDECTTKIAHDKFDPKRGLNDCVAFWVKKGEKVDSVLINKKQQVIATGANAIALCWEIEKIQIHRSFLTFKEIEKEEEEDNYQREMLEHLYKKKS